MAHATYKVHQDETKPRESRYAGTMRLGIAVAVCMRSLFLSLSLSLSLRAHEWSVFPRTSVNANANELPRLNPSPSARTLKQARSRNNHTYTRITFGLCILRQLVGPTAAPAQIRGGGARKKNRKTKARWVGLGKWHDGFVYLQVPAV